MSKRPFVAHLRRTRSGEWRLRVVHRNGQVIAWTESYRRRRDAVKVARLFRIDLVELDFLVP